MRIVRIGAIVAVLLAVGLAPLGASAATPAWRAQRAKAPKGATDTSLNGVSCGAPTACMAVGNYNVNFTTGGSLAEFWNGSSWKIQKPPTKASDLVAVSCIAASQCVAVGDSYDQSTFTSSALAAGWNGTKWVVQKSRLPKGSTASQLTGVSCTSATACIAVGWSNGATGSAPLAESWNGVKWAILKPKVPATPSPSVEFSSVSCTSATQCVAVGTAFTSDGFDSLPLAELWNGSTWAIQTVPAPAGGVSVTLTGVACPAATECIAVGYDHQSTSTGPLAMLAEFWNGSTWTIQTTPPVASTLSAVSCASTTACTAVGFGFGGTGATAAAWDGGTWTAQTVPAVAGITNATLVGVSCAANTVCTAVGAGNLSSGHLTSLIERYS